MGWPELSTVVPDNKSAMDARHHGIAYVTTGSGQCRASVQRKQTRLVVQTRVPRYRTGRPREAWMIVVVVRFTLAMLAHQKPICRHQKLTPLLDVGEVVFVVEQDSGRRLRGLIVGYTYLRDRWQSC